MLGSPPSSQETTPRTSDVIEVFQRDSGRSAATTIANLASIINAESTVPFADSTAIVKGSSDATKLLRFEIDGFTTATTRVVTVPNADGTIAYLASPTFTGTPAAPTADPGTSTTQLATTAFVQAALADVPGGAFVIDAVLAEPPSVITPQTSTSTTPANLTGFSHAVVTGGTYVGRLVVYCSTDQAAEGARFDFDGGTAVWQDFRANIVAALGCTVSVGTAADDATDLIATSLGDTTMRCFVIEFAGAVTTGGTLIPRFGQSTHSSGTLTIGVGSHFDLTTVSVP